MIAILQDSLEAARYCGLVDKSLRLIHPQHIANLSSTIDLDPQIMHSDLGASIAREATYPVYDGE